MNAPAPSRLWLAFPIAGGLLLAIGAVFLTVTRGDPISPLFRHPLTVQIIVGLLTWSLLAWTARLLIVGKLRKLRLNSMAAFIWGGSRLALWLATLTVLVSWLATLALGLLVETALARATVLLVMVTAFMGIIGGAFFNSTLVIRRWRALGTE